MMMFAAIVLAAAAIPPAVQDGLDRFNRALISATRRMDNAATLALWEHDGISLLPATPPIIGKQALAAFLDDVTAKYPGAQMESFDLRCAPVSASGELAAEWCTEHQVVRFAGGKPPFDGRGTIVFVLHRGADGEWRIRAEMWNPAPAHP